MSDRSRRASANSGRVRRARHLTPREEFTGKMKSLTEGMVDEGSVDLT